MTGASLQQVSAAQGRSMVTQSTLSQ